MYVHVYTHVVTILFYVTLHMFMYFNINLSVRVIPLQYQRAVFFSTTRKSELF